MTSLLPLFPLIRWPLPQKPSAQFPGLLHVLCPSIIVTTWQSKMLSKADETVSKVGFLFPLSP